STSGFFFGGVGFNQHAVRKRFYVHSLLLFLLVLNIFVALFDACQGVYISIRMPNPFFASFVSFRLGATAKMAHPLTNYHKNEPHTSRLVS
ncbi:MAG: hypothetical protein IKV60_01265, partial [Rikenellaceae bacterium]|nr:hypothetical protein [Rikenellaceae bacterium]